MGKMSMARALFDRFDSDKDGFWSWLEASQLVVSTLGVKLTQQKFLAMLSAVLGSEHSLTETEFRKGLSKEQVVDLYTKPEINKMFPVIFNLQRDHVIVFATKDAIPCTSCG